MHNQLPIKPLATESLMRLVTAFYTCCHNSLLEKLCLQGEDFWKLMPDFLDTLLHVAFPFADFLGICICLPELCNKIPQTGWLKQQKFTFLKFWIDMMIGVVPPGASLPGLQMATHFLPLHMVISLFMCPWCLSVCPNLHL